MVDQFFLNPKARLDLRDIWLFGADRWGVAKADEYLESLHTSFESLGVHPNAGHYRDEFIVPVSTWLSGSHVILYRIEDVVEILRIVHQFSDWHDLDSADLFGEISFR